MVDGTIRAETANAANAAATRLALKNCAPFTKCNLEINDEHVDTAENLDITMHMYNLIEYSDNYQNSSATLYQYKRDEPPEANAINDLTTNTSSSFKYKIKLLSNPVLDGNIAKRSIYYKGEDYTTGSLLDFNYFDKHYKLVAVDLSRQKELDADPSAIQQIEF